MVMECLKDICLPSSQSEGTEQNVSRRSRWKQLPTDEYWNGFKPHYLLELESLWWPELPQPQGSQWETFTKLNLDEDAEWPVLSRSPLQSLGAWAAPQNGSAPRHWFIIHHDHKLMDEEGIPMAATIPAPLASDKSASSEHDCPRKKQRLHCSVQYMAACSSPLHRTLIFKAIHD